MANFKELSRYTGGITSTNRKDQKFLVLRNQIVLTPADDDIFVTVTQDVQQRPDLISFQVYSTPDLWWVIYDFNDIKNPLFELNVGQVLRIPALERVLSAINSLTS